MLRSEVYNVQCLCWSIVQYFGWTMYALFGFAGNIFIHSFIRPFHSFVHLIIHLQYDAKLLKLQKQNSKNQCGQSSSSSINHEIFRRVCPYPQPQPIPAPRVHVMVVCTLFVIPSIVEFYNLFCSDLLQKLQHAKAESDREIAALKRQVSDLERQLATVNKRRRLWTHWRVQETICTISSSQL